MFTEINPTVNDPTDTGTDTFLKWAVGLYPWEHLRDLGHLVNVVLVQALEYLLHPAFIYYRS